VAHMGVSKGREKAVNKFIKEGLAAKGRGGWRVSGA